MTRTTRKPLHSIENTLERNIAEKLNYHRLNGFKENRRFKKTDEQHAADFVRIEKEYQLELAKLKKVYSYSWWRPESCMHKYYANALKELDRRFFWKKIRWVRVDVVITEEEVIAKAKADFAKYTRDGHWNETGRNKYYKELNRKHIRGATKKLIRRIMKDEVYDDISYPGDYMGKKYIWDVW